MAISEVKPRPGAPEVQKPNPYGAPAVRAQEPKPTEEVESDAVSVRISAKGADMAREDRRAADDRIDDMAAQLKRETEFHKKVNLNA